MILQSALKIAMNLSKIRRSKRHLKKPYKFSKKSKIWLKLRKVETLRAVLKLADSSLRNFLTTKFEVFSTFSLRIV